MISRPAVIPLVLLLVLGVSFFGSLLLADRYFPRTYDWRRTVISSLASPRDNPQGYRIACGGMALSGLILLFFPQHLHKKFRNFSPRLALWAGRFLFLGSVGLFLAAIIVPGHYRILGLGRSHEHFAQVAAVSFCLALVLYVAALLRLSRTPGRIKILALTFVLLPVTALAASRLALLFAYQFLSDPVYHAVRASLWSSLALWEWIGALSLYFFLIIMTLVPEEGQIDPKLFEGTI